MAWFKIDDGFHCHPKVFAAGTPAVGLYVRCGSWAAQQTTDGIVPKQIARMYGTPRMIKSLVEAGLWHQQGHECESCPELDANSYAIHQYLERNSSRVEVELARKAKSERQQRWREGKRKPQANEGPASNVDGDVDASTSRHGDAAPIPSHPIPLPPPMEEEEELRKPATRAGEVDVPRIGDRPRIPANCEPLITTLQAAQLVVGWDLRPDEWFLIEALIARCGIPALVTSANASWQGARTPPRSGRYFLPAWRQLPDAAPAGTPVPALAPVQNLTGTDARVAGWLALGAKYDNTETA